MIARLQGVARNRARVGGRAPARVRGRHGRGPAPLVAPNLRRESHRGGADPTERASSSPADGPAGFDYRPAVRYCVIACVNAVAASFWNEVLTSSAASVA